MGKHRKKSKPISLFIAAGVLGTAWTTLAVGHGRAAESVTAFTAGTMRLDMPDETVRASRVNYRKAIIPPPPEVIKPISELAVQIALTKLGVPYVWGSKGPNTFDCSGLTQWAYKQEGISIGPDTYTQIKQGTAIPPNQVKPGDLIFPSLHHVQLAISSTQVIEAPGRGMTVRIVKIPGNFQARRIT